ncbi:mixed lineage kinase domain-like protein isoform X1 [Maylandia zebra]|uniref:mixed lineage kinase domain-like protein isoform X1 n=1 Tax=Maylandia zebra TaxID=106582 RepID=UPI00032A18B7|nr:mixed lineage kinase domain-like protein [Maylandia zebra]
MDFVDPILSIASQIYDLVENVKANKKRCRRVCNRVKALEKLVKSIKRTPPGVEKPLRELSVTLQSAQELIRKYASANLVERILNSSNHGDEFNSVNERLNDAFQVLSGALQVEQGNMLYEVFKQTTREKEDQLDGREDDAELKTLLLDYMKDQQEKTNTMLKQFEHLKVNVEKVVEMLNKPSITSVDIRMIKPQELKYKHPKKPFMETATSEVYKGEYRGFTVAIKRYIDPVNTNLGKVQSIFNKEVDTMKRFESPNILRMFGISILGENGPNPQFFIIMEYCEKGSLRQVLDSDCRLSWIRKARMCFDAAQGLYRLHNTEEKSKVHGCINSSKFLVAEGYTVKLGGFELAKTETSLKKVKKSTNDDAIRSLCYYSPERLNNINHPYSKECEMYSFGIVLWEVATRKKPFEGFSDEEIYRKVLEEKCKEPLPDDCPAELGQLINECRDFDSFQRPSAGVLVDRLRSVVAQLEDQ